MNTSGDRLRTLLRECHLSATDFAANRRVTPQHVNNWFKRGIPMARLDEVAELLSVSPRWLRTGEGPKHPTEPANESDGGEPTPGPAPASLADVEIQVFQQAEAGQHVLSEVAGRKIRLPRHTLDELNIHPKDAMCLSMNGNSMADRLHNGSLLGIDRNTTQVIDGEMYALEHGGLLRIRYLYRLPNGGLRLRSHNNHEYPDESFSAEQIHQQGIRVLGWVFWWSTLNQRKNPPAAS
ncbi:helix-turn-helix transcriptional regulator [Pseudomonas sp. 21LCFQ010]|uniref:LexA family transcriptional regulator n=1 Tax=Pseudomonas sp. 21LCFQ010 TaxID=2957506 RepID=UPI00209824BD|nr:helix-turn-helix transcriptional regulator [Pseudomonas sp. 21LCFQ010]MCO8162949.1 helix-turn-helix transcriptional regulator [Pseudomonas sp. 21LCFQ010]